MNGVLMEIRHTKWESQRNLGLAKGLRDATRDYLRRRWPSGTAKYVARAFGLTHDRAREAVAGRASLTTIEAIFRHGGPSVFLPVLEDVWGESIARYFREMRLDHEENGRRLASVFGDPWTERGPDRRADSGGPWSSDRGSEPAGRRVGETPDRRSSGRAQS